MKKINKIFFSLICLVFIFSASDKVLAAKDCRCATDLSAVNAVALYKNQKSKTPTILKSQCIESPGANTCKPDKHAALTKGKLSPDCWPEASADICDANSQEWQIKFDSMLTEGKNTAESSAQSTPAGASTLADLIGKCGLAKMDAACWDVTVFVSLLLQLTNYLFGIIGALALGAFIYGGFVLILSQGNPEKVKQGTGAMINAVIGLLVAFGGYVLVSFLGEILKLKSDFSLLK